MKICKNCKYYTNWYSESRGYCIEILKQLGITESEISDLVYAEVTETFFCGTFKRKE